MDYPFFSVIIPSFNRANIILGSVMSVLQQTFKSFELIVVDDGSIDDTKALISDIHDQRIKYVYQPNSGVSQARNTGASHAHGKYLLFLDSDDSFTLNYLEKLHEQFSKGNYSIGFGYAKYLDPNGKQIAFVQPEKSKDWYGPQLAGAFAISRLFYEEMSGYDKNLAYSENTEFFLRIKLKNKLHEDAICLVPEEGVIVNFRDSRERFEAYSATKYKSTGYFLEKHKDYFSHSVEAFVNYKTIYALSAFQTGNINDARRSIMDVIRKKPFRIKSYFQYLLFNFPFFARMYWKKTKTDKI